MSHLYVAALYHDEGNTKRTMKIVECGTPFHAAQALLKEVADASGEVGFVQLLGWRYEQPWTDPAERFWEVCSFGNSISGQRIWVYKQIGGFENTLTDLRQWGQA